MPVQCHVKEGQTVHVVASHTEHYLQSLEIVDLSREMVGEIGHPQLVGDAQARKLAVALDVAR